MGEGRFGSSGAGQQRGRFLFLVVVAAVASVLAIPSGCGLDDSAVTALDPADGSLVDGFASGEASLGDAGTPDVYVCPVDTCANYPSVCRSDLDSGCGSTIDCTNACPAGQKCITASGTCDGPPVCRDAGAPGGNCEQIVNPGNGLDASCGECANPGYTCVSSTCTCGTGGTVCGANCCNGATPDCNAGNTGCCLKITACAAGTCNPVNANGCGGNLDCSANCGASAAIQCGTDHVCAPAPTCTNKGTNGGSCGIVAGTHGLTIDCGTCATPGYSCVSNICRCTPEPMATTCTNKCGTVSNNCGTSVDCGDCETGEVCSGSANCTCHTQTCTPGQACCGPNGGHYCHTGGLPCQ